MSLTSTYRLGSHQGQAAAVSLMLILAGCGSVSSTGGSAGLSGAQSDVVAEAVAHVVRADDSLGQLVDGNEESLTFKASSDAAQAQTGQLIISASPNAPFLRRVTSRTVTSSGDVVLGTESVPLDQAFELVGGEVAGSFVSFTPSDGITVLEKSFGKTKRLVAGKYGPTLKEFPVVDLNMGIKTNDNNAEAAIGLKLKMSAIMELDGGVLAGLRRIKVSVKSDYEMELGLTFKAVTFLSQEVPLGTAVVLFPFGPIPVYTTIDLVLEIGGDISGALVVTWKGGSEVGGEWTAESGWSEILTDRLDAGEGKVQAKATIEALTSARWKIYGVLGPKIGFGPFFEAGLDSSEPCDLTFAIGLKGVAAIQFGKSVINRELGDSKAFALSRSQVLKTGKVRFCDPTPAAPSNLKAGAMGGLAPVALTWQDNSNNEANFLVRWNDGGGWTDLVYLPANATAFAHNDPSPGLDNLYEVFAVGASGTLSESSNLVVVAINELEPPAVPTDLAAFVDGNTAVVLSWTDNSDNETFFSVERAEGDGGFVALATVEADVFGYRDIMVQRAKTYSYRIRSQNRQGASGFSNVAVAKVEAFIVEAAPPAAPTALSAVVQSDGDITLAWADNSSREDGFTIERSRDGGAWAAIATLGAGASAYVDTTVGSTGTYAYRVNAFNADGTSDYSNVATAQESALQEDDPNADVCVLFGSCCADDGVCDDSWFACPAEDTDCARCGVKDGRCIESCLEADPDCPSRQLICNVLDVCCANDGRCDVECPLSEIDPDCTNTAMCDLTGNCCDGDQVCHTFCNELDADCQASGSGGGGGGGGTSDEGAADAGAGDTASGNEDSSTCPTVRYINSLFSQVPLRVVTPDLDQTLDVFNESPRIPYCEMQTVQVLDTGGAVLASFSIPFGAIDVAPDERPIVFVQYRDDTGFTAWIEYFSLDPVDLFP